MYSYIKAIHIIFVVTWFAGMFYMPRLFIYNAEAAERPEAEKKVLREQFQIMMTRLWYGITWPSAIATLVFGPWMWFLLGALPRWLEIKLIFVLGLYIYHLSLHRIYREQVRGLFRYSSSQLRLWNEVATVFLFAIVFIATLKDSWSWIWGLVSVVCLMGVLMLAIRIYKRIRSGTK
jgi:putative membrane protein